MPPHEVTSVEGRILREQIQEIGTTVLTQYQEISSALGEQSELIGKLWSKVEDIHATVMPPKHVNGGHIMKHQPERHQPEPAPDRPSLPPKVVGGTHFEGTTTGSYRVPPEDLLKLEGDIAKIRADQQKAEQEKREANIRAEERDRLAKEAEAKFKTLQNRVRFFGYVFGGLVAAVVGAYELVVWAAHHVK
jgi:hypothetical protein